MIVHDLKNEDTTEQDVLLMMLLRGEMQLCLILMPLKKHDGKGMIIVSVALGKECLT